MTVFTGNGEDIGVIADDVTINDLQDMINETRGFPEQEIFIINADGLYVTHEDTGAIDKIVGSVDSLNEAVYAQATHITQSSAAIEQMVAHINSIRQAADK